MSPSAAAPSTASVTAWQTMSASEWPSRPSSNGTVDAGQHQAAGRAPGDAGRSRCRCASAPAAGAALGPQIAGGRDLHVGRPRPPPAARRRRPVRPGRPRRWRRRRRPRANAAASTSRRERLRRLHQVDRPRAAACSPTHTRAVARPRRASPCRGRAPPARPRRRRRTASIMRSIRAALTNGRAASCTSTTSASGATLREGPRHRVATPGAAGHGPHRRRPRRPQARRQRIEVRRRQRHDHFVDARMRAPAPPGCARAASGRRAARNCFGTPPPARVPSPPAARIALTNGRAVTPPTAPVSRPPTVAATRAAVRSSTCAHLARPSPTPARRPRSARRRVAGVTIARAESDVGLPNGPRRVGGGQPAGHVHGVLADAGVGLAVGAEADGDRPAQRPRDRRRRRAAAIRASTGSRHRPAR